MTTEASVPPRGSPYRVSKLSTVENLFLRGVDRVRPSRYSAFLVMRNGGSRVMARPPRIRRFKITLKDIKPPIWRRIENAGETSQRDASRITQPTRLIASKCVSYVRTVAPERAAVAATQMSFVGRGVPVFFRATTISPYNLATS